MGKGRATLLLIFIAVLSIVFLPTAVILFVGLIPSFVAFFVDSTPKKTRAVTVGSYNVMGCVPFMLDLWEVSGDLDVAIDILFTPLTLVVIYAAAAVGYFIYWGAGLVISSFFYQQGQSRRSDIVKRKQELIERWGRDVTGVVQNDE
tara:strand:- start:5137 stop:5577 length:441 start_codon:yes stop_codon:yes gene_type:complete